MQRWAGKWPYVITGLGGNPEGWCQHCLCSLVAGQRRHRGSVRQTVPGLGQASRVRSAHLKHSPTFIAISCHLFCIADLISESTWSILRWIIVCHMYTCTFYCRHPLLDRYRWFVCALFHHCTKSFFGFFPKNQEHQKSIWSQYPHFDSDPL